MTDLRSGKLKRHYFIPGIENTWWSLGLCYYCVTMSHISVFPLTDSSSLGKEGKSDLCNEIRLPDPERGYPRDLMETDLES